MESKHSPEIPDTGADIRHPRPPFGGLAEGRRQTSTEKHKERAPKEHSVTPAEELSARVEVGRVTGSGSGSLGQWTSCAHAVTTGPETARNGVFVLGSDVNEAARSNEISLP